MKIDPLKNSPIVLQKVKVHNLKEVNLTLPSHRFIVFTGVSGSGKSSMAFDTIFVEGQRRYIESLTAHAKRFLGELAKPDAELISGLSPTIAIEQKTIGKTPRSTVGTMTGIHDYLRVLFAKVAIPHCPISGEAVQPQSKEKIIQAILSLPLNTKFLLLSPYAKNKKAGFKEDFKELQSRGFIKVRINGKITDLSEVEELEATQSHTIDIVIDRLIRDPQYEERIKESISLGLDLSKGFFTLLNLTTNEEIFFSQYAYAQKSQISYGPLEPQDFSFNHPQGMCPTCQGIGELFTFDLDKIIDREKSIEEECCLIAPSYKTVYFGNIYRNLAKLYDFSVSTPWKNLPKEAKNIFLYGSKGKWLSMVFTHPQKKKRWKEYVQWQGVIPEAERRLKEAQSDLYRKKMHALMSVSICPDCKMSRLKPYPSAAKLFGKTLFEITNLTIEELKLFFEKIPLSDLEKLIASDLIIEIQKRLQYLLDVGLSYLTLSRSSPTLSGGESQRVRLASQIGCGLIGTCYILDEPSIGLHPVDHKKMIQTLRSLVDAGNTIIVVEHDEETMRSADLIVDFGPKAGIFGGEIVAQGTLAEIQNNPRSLTGKYLSGELSIKIPEKRKISSKALTIHSASHHNLKDVTVSIPLGCLVCVTGVSGSGKSSLISDILCPALSNALHHAELPCGKHQSIEGIENINKVIFVDQSPIGKTPRSNPATYIKLYDDIRTLFASLPESKAKGFEAGHFSFNVTEGSCPYCKGLGEVKVDLDFMEDQQTECKQCKGKRFDEEILNVTYKGKNILDILEMEVSTAFNHFSALPQIAHKLKTLMEVGLDYLQLGQPSNTLSGGEAQRIKLAKELTRPETGKTLYILDEPTTGLHFDDMKKLLKVIEQLIDQGNSAIVIEHNMDFVKVADYVIDMGPGAGSLGGEIIGIGSPEELAKKKSATGKALQDVFKRKKGIVSSYPQKVLSSFPLHLEIKKASEHNLQEISLTVPHNRISIFTGPSGSGKTSLAFDTIYAEGQRRYIEALPPYARQFLKQLAKPKVEEINSLIPSIAIEQRGHMANPRSTIGTLTEVYDRLRVLFAYLGTPYCPETGEKIESITKEQAAKTLLEQAANEKVHILSPLTLKKEEKFSDLIERLSSKGFLRLRINKKYVTLDEQIDLDRSQKNEIFLVVDRLEISPKSEMRLLEAIRISASLSDGIVIAATEKEDLFFNLSFGVRKTGKSYPKITPQTFSFNSEEGMCLECQGLGTIFGADIVSPEEYSRKSILSICRRLFHTSDELNFIRDYFASFDIDVFSPLSHLSKKQILFFLHGDLEKTFQAKDGLQFSWRGINPTLALIAKQGTPLHKFFLVPVMEQHLCPLCKGVRLNSLARAVKLKGHTIESILSLELEKVFHFFATISLTKEERKVVGEILKQIQSQISFMMEIGLGYLSLDRSAPSLSGGEMQRIRLARQLGSGLTSCLYVLDEPTIGLHPHNSDLLNNALKKLKDLGNTLIIVEHDPQTIVEADRIYEFGPGAGVKGGKIVASGTVEEIKKNPLSLTGQYLTGKKSIPCPTSYRKGNEEIIIHKASLHNLKNISVSLPTEVMIGVSGVSGSGKSTLIHQILKPALMQSLRQKKREDMIDLGFGKVSGLNYFDQLIVLDQSPIGQTSRSDVCTYSDVLTGLRSHFSSFPTAKAKGLLPRHFSYNHKKGMCQTCFGFGYRMVELQFLPPVKVPCEGCLGKRLNPISLSVKYKGKDFGDILEMTVEEAHEFFEVIPQITRKLGKLLSVGLGYVKLGQEITTLSGGEAQRLRLAKELSKRSTGRTLYLFDEPSTGLHTEDLAKLIPLFHQLVDKKNTLIIIEHNMEILKQVDWLIDLGPEAGDKGGEVIAKGTPHQVAKVVGSYTGRYLKKYL